MPDRHLSDEDEVRWPSQSVCVDHAAGGSVQSVYSVHQSPITWQPSEEGTSWMSFFSVNVVLFSSCVQDRQHVCSSLCEMSNDLTMLLPSAMFSCCVRPLFLLMASLTVSLLLLFAARRMSSSVGTLKVGWTFKPSWSANGCCCMNLERITDICTALVQRPFATCARLQGLDLVDRQLPG